MAEFTDAYHEPRLVNSIAVDKWNTLRFAKHTHTICVAVISCCKIPTDYIWILYSGLFRFYCNKLTIPPMPRKQSWRNLINGSHGPTRILVTLRPSDAIWRQGSGSMLAQEMACCLTTPSHRMNQCWNIIIKVHWYPPVDNSQEIPQTLTTDHIYLEKCVYIVKSTYLNIHTNLVGTNVLIRKDEKELILRLCIMRVLST